MMINYSFCNKPNLSCPLTPFPHHLPTNLYPVRIFSVSKASEQLLRAADCLLAVFLCLFVCFSLKNITVKQNCISSFNVDKIFSFTLVWSTERAIYCPLSLLTGLESVILCLIWQRLRGEVSRRQHCNTGSPRKCWCRDFRCYWLTQWLCQSHLWFHRISWDWNLCAQLLNSKLCSWHLNEDSS